MNLFFLSLDPTRAAQMQCDKHVVKMILEVAQMLSTACWHRAPLRHCLNIYKETHRNHPMAVWVRSTRGNFLWTVLHGLALCEEYTKRYQRTHKSEKLIRKFSKIVEDLDFKAEAWTEPPQCMPDEYKKAKVVAAYRAYYKGDKKRFAKWKLGNKPKWF